MAKKPAGETFKSAADLATHIFGYLMLLIIGTVVGFLVIPYSFGWALGPGLVALAAVGHVMQAFEK